MSFLFSRLGRYVFARVIGGIIVALIAVLASILTIDLVEQMRTVGTRTEISILEAVRLTLLKVDPFHVGSLWRDWSFARGWLRETEDLDANSDAFYLALEELIQVRLFAMEAEARGFEAFAIREDRRRSLRKRLCMIVKSHGRMLAAGRQR